MNKFEINFPKKTNIIQKTRIYQVDITNPTDTPWTIQEIREFLQKQSNKVSHKYKSDFFSVALQFEYDGWRGAQSTIPGQPIKLYNPSDSDKDFDDMGNVIKIAMYIKIE